MAKWPEVAVSRALPPVGAPWPGGWGQEHLGHMSPGARCCHGKEGPSLRWPVFRGGAYFKLI